MRMQSRYIAAAVTAAVAALAMGQASAQSYGYSDYGRGNGYDYGRARAVRCESVNSRRTFCRVDARGDVQITRQLSHSRCIEGRNWGSNPNGIWVSNGCRAEFRISSRNDYRRNDGYGRNGDYRNGNNDYRDGNDGYNRDGYNSYNGNDGDDNDDGDRPQ
jgi:hypothetical protein